jgi:hypothetical protein
MKKKIGKVFFIISLFFFFVLNLGYAQNFQLNDKNLDGKLYVNANLTINKFPEKFFFQKEINFDKVISNNDIKIIKFLKSKFNGSLKNVNLECLLSIIDPNSNILLDKIKDPLNLYKLKKYDIIETKNAVIKPKLNKNFLYLKFFLSLEGVEKKIIYYDSKYDSFILTIPIDNFPKKIKGFDRYIVLKLEKKLKLDKITLSNLYGFTDIQQEFFGFNDYFFFNLKNKLLLNKTLLHIHLNNNNNNISDIKILKMIPKLIYVANKNKEKKLNIFTKKSEEPQIYPCPKKTLTLYASNIKNSDTDNQKKKIINELISSPVAETSKYQLFIDSSELNKLALLNRTSYLFNIKLRVEKKNSIYKKLNSNVKILSIY